METWRRVGAGLRTALAAAVLSLCLAAPASAAKLLSVSGSEQAGYGRIVLTFDTPVTTKARVSGTVLALGFAQAVAMGGDKLATEMPAYVTVSRRDPDGTGLRVALQGLFRVNVLEAGERTFVDLLPPDWSGLPPALPADVVADLSRRAREAEARLRREAEVRGQNAAPPAVLPLRVARLPTLLRLALPIPPQVNAAFTTGKGTVNLHLDRPFRLDEEEARGQLDPAVEGMSAVADTGNTDLALRLAEGYEAQGFRDDDGYVIDITKSAVVAKPEAGRDAKPLGKAAAAKPSPPVARPPAAPKPEAAAPARPSAPADAAPPAAIAPPDTQVRASLGTADGTTFLAFPFKAPTAAALFERGGVATLVFETGAKIDLPDLPADARLRLSAPPERVGGFVVLRVALPEPRLLQLAPGPGGAWTLAVGDARSAVVATLTGRPARDERRQPTVVVPLKRPGGALWLDGADDRIAVVTAFGPEAAGVSKRQRFVDFEIVPSSQGVAVLAAADDLTVRPGLDGVVIGRETGLTLSPADTVIPEAAAADTGDVDLAIDPKVWATMRGGDILGRMREAVQALVAAPFAGRTPARVQLAHLMIAANYLPEALGALEYAEREDPTLSSDRRFLMLAGIAALRLHRDANATTYLTSGPLGPDPEAKLWRALLDARNGRWGPALTALTAGDPIIQRYPDDLHGDFALATAQAAIEKLDLARAETALEEAKPLVSSGTGKERFALLRARLDAESGRPKEALDALQKIADTASRPIAAEADLRWTELALITGAVTREEAIPRLERLSIAWRGDGIEARTIVKLARLYAEAGRWREAFAKTRIADRKFTDHELTRELHADMMRLFEQIFLTDLGAKLPRLEYVSLYFDFKEFSPLGRRGDDIVRHLADRLVELDLLDSAATLLQHQIDHRLTGAARATVAAKLATIRLADGKPLKALEVLRATRLAELPAEAKRARTLLEARALSDLSRTDLALDLVADDPAPDVQRLRADILWNARRWRDAGEAHEGLLGDRWRSGGPLNDIERADVIRSAVGYALANDVLGLDRLRAKYAAKMSDSVDARTFALLAAPNAGTTGAFRELARRAATADTLAAFLREYRKRYPEMAVPERQPRPEATPAPVPQSATAEPAAPARG